MIYTKPRHEKKVYQDLQIRQIDSFLPIKQSLKNWHDRKKLIDEPLFPSYVFLYINNVDTYYKSLSVDGAMYYVKEGAKPARVQEKVIANLRILMQSRSQMEVSTLKFEKGEKLLIAKGPLAGLNCELIKYAGRHKILVRVELLSRSILMAVAEDYLISC